MRAPGTASGPGGRDGPPDDLLLRPGTAEEDWRGWAGDVAAVLRRHWPVMAAVLLVTMVLPVLALSGVIAGCAYVGAQVSLNGQELTGTMAATIVAGPALLALAVGAGLVVARGWTGVVWAVASAGSRRRAGLRDIPRWSGHRSGLLWGWYLAGVAVLAGGAFLAGSQAPGAPTVPDLLMLAGPAGLLAPVLSFSPAASWLRRAPAAARRRACLAPMGFALAMVVSGEVAVAVALSWLMSSPSPYAIGPGLDGIKGPAAAVIASLVALPGSVLLAAASAVSYARWLGSRGGR